MEQGFIKIGAGTPPVKVGDPVYNGEQIVRLAREMNQAGARVMVMPELGVTAYTCGDLFWQEKLLRETKAQLLHIAEETEALDGILFVGLPVEYRGKLYNAAAAISGGEVLGLVPKTWLPNYNDSYELRYFASGEEAEGNVELEEGVLVPFSREQIFVCPQMPQLKIAVEIGADLLAPNPPSIRHAIEGEANVIVNLGAYGDVVGRDAYWKKLVSGQSARLVCAYVCAAAGKGESTQDGVFGGRNLICENGILLGESGRFGQETVYGDVDVHSLVNERRRMNIFPAPEDGCEYEQQFFEVRDTHTRLDRRYAPNPFVPEDEKERDSRCDEILNLQAIGLKSRLEHIHGERAVIGLSGGLDSTLALLVTARAFDMLGLPRANITAVTMPCFGTTDRTYRNACVLSERLGATLREVNIREAVSQHFRDIGHDPENHNVTYENSQARERTQVLMDIANEINGLVVGTGDLSELALGWATYNGDHMSMYGVNGSVPKTLVRHLVRYYAAVCGDERLEEALLDILDTPVSPELLPPKDGVIAQKTEDLVGPYELHDFFLYYMLRQAFPPRKIFRIAKNTFRGQYDEETILKWMRTFYRRFFTQQFKRSCLPDGPKVGSVAVSPRGDLRIPSDASAGIWLRELDELS